MRTAFEHRLLLGVLAVALGASAMAASRKLDDAPTPVIVKALIDCRQIADAGKRLECFDAAAGALDAAIVSKSVYVVDKAEVRKTRRSLFGLALPSLKLFGDGSDDVNAVQTIAATVRTASRLRDGNWTMTLDDDTVWAQTDGLPFALEPKTGSKIVIKRAALGSYKMRVENQPAVRVRRTF